MSTVLVVDDSPPARALVARILTAHLGGDIRVRQAGNGAEALDALAAELPDVVITDIRMPVMGGLELVQAVREEHPGLPVVVMTAEGSEELVLAALKAGAASYVPKLYLARDLAETVEGLFAVTHDRRAEQRLFGCLTRADADFVLDNDTALVPPLVKYAQDGLRRVGFCPEGDAVQIGVALREALANAIEHGNLEVQSELKAADHKAFHRLVGERRGAAPYRDRRVTFQIRQSAAEVTYVIRDEGPGFVPSAVADPLAPENLDRPHGRGLLLIRTFMDDVRHNPTGNEITLTKRRG